MNNIDSKELLDLEELDEYKEKGEVVGGSYTKAWYKIDGTRFLYKQYENDLLAFGEVLYYEASKQANVNCAKYDFCKDGENIGVITYDFLNKNEAYYSALELTSEFSNSKFSLDEIQRDRDLLSLYNLKYNNLENFKNILFNLFDISGEEKENIDEELVKMFCLDTLFLHGDRNLWNYGIIVEEDSDKMRLAPIHDNSHVLKLDKGRQYIKEMITSFDSENFMERLAREENGSIDQLISFYEKSNDKIRKIIDNIMYNIDVPNLVNEVNNRYEIDDVSLLWIKAMLNYRQNCILKGMESVKINNSGARTSNLNFNKRK